MKRRILTDVECMSGTGWYPEDDWLECPNCWADIVEEEIKGKIKCSSCNTSFNVLKGQLNLIKLEFRSTGD